MMRSVIAMPGQGPRTTERFAVQVRQDDHVLWSGEMMRASDGMASFSEQMRESRACTEGEMPASGRSNVSQNSSLSVSISPNYPFAEGVVRISVERTRPYGEAAAGCEGEEGSSTVRFETRAQLPAGKAVTLRGESGLSVTITRR
ncbi:MAG TPA: hypothetical protein VKQ09_00860 [Sphingomonas sp.]|nr:hypothetical protein [Sphingomonas sp.]